MKRASDWAAILTAYLIGVVGAVQVGRIAPAATSLRSEFDLGLAELGWSVSLVTLASAILGLLAGYWVNTTGPRLALLVGCALLTVSVFVSSLSTSSLMLLSIRAIEGFGYLAIVVAAPTLIAAEAKERDMPRALALWGTFFTLGLSLGAIAGGWVSDIFGWQLWFVSNGVLLVLTLALAYMMLPAGATTEPDMPQATREGRRLPAAS